MNVLKIYKGEEYQEKKEYEIKEDNYLFKTYKRCIDVICDICKEQENRTDKDRKIDNVLMITGRRGDGKTSTLCTIADYLSKTRKERVKIIPGMEMEGNFYVMNDIIDPSSMASGESIIRIFLSRLYEEYNKKKREYKSSGSQYERKDAQELLELFQKCYQNLTNIDQHENGGKYDQDELDILSDLGDSSNLARNIHNLVQKMLLFLKKDDVIFDYLVVKIDDTDLAGGNVYKIVDDIRNYLMLCGVIVIMAVDYEQLEMAVKQAYINKYNNIIDIELKCGKNRAPSIIDRCYTQAARYIEKVFPEGHCVAIPRLEEGLLSETNNLIFEYYDNRTKLYGIDEGDTITKQLLGILYNKTGIVLYSDESQPNRFIPGTLRELTHFVRMLDDLAELRTQKGKAYAYDIYIETCSGKECADEKEKLKNNIKRIIDYIINYWCPAHLSIDKTSIIREYLYSAEQTRNDYPSSNRLQSSYDNNAIGDEYYRDAITIADTCRDNMKMLAVWGNDLRRSKQGKLIKERISWDRTIYNHEMNYGDNYIYFQIDLEMLKNEIKKFENNDNKLEEMETYINMFCRVDWKKGDEAYLSVLEALKNDRINSIYFDLIGAPLYILQTEYLKDIITSDVQVLDDTSKEDTFVNNTELDKEIRKNNKVKREYVLSDARDVVVNTGFLKKYYEIVADNLNSYMSKNKPFSWGDIINVARLYIDNAISKIRVGHVNEKKYSDLSEYIVEINRNEQSIMVLTMCNKEIKKQMELDQITILEDLGNTIDSIMNKNYAEDFYEEQPDVYRWKYYFASRVKVIEDMQFKKEKDPNWKYEGDSIIDKVNYIIAKTNLEIQSLQNKRNEMLKGNIEEGKKKLEEFQKQQKQKWYRITNEIMNLKKVIKAQHEAANMITEF